MEVLEPNLTCTECVGTKNTGNAGKVRDKNKILVVNDKIM